MIASRAVRRRARALLSTCESPLLVGFRTPQKPDPRGSALAMKPGAGWGGAGARGNGERGLGREAGVLRPGSAAGREPWFRVVWERVPRAVVNSEPRVQVWGV